MHWHLADGGGAEDALAVAFAHCFSSSDLGIQPAGLDINFIIVNEFCTRLIFGPVLYDEATLLRQRKPLAFLQI